MEIAGHPPLPTSANGYIAASDHRKDGWPVGF
jgi:hypothetical protein